ncbi:unnamed protein product [Mytilus coruscus]|uniref:Reverse transcriptase domain-containing protein n=1 Tax=Mytilus coruscus TaxID=42192 RepID=A0A6J8BQ55_MYTCO|nr:unnamed protein product [Mytilus coruscus]
MDKKETWALIDKRRNLREKKQSARSERLIEKYNKEYSQDKNGTKITIEYEQLKRWAEHFNEVLNRPEPVETPSVDKPIGEPFDIELGPPTKEEISKAINKLKNNKSPGIDNIESEMLKTDTKLATEQLHKLFTKVWIEEILPNDWCEGLIVKLQKKGNKMDCTNWRGITLLSVPSKVFCKIICMRLSYTKDEIIRKEQAGFRPGVG